MADTDLWEKWDVQHVTTHRDGSVAARICCYAAAWPALLRELWRRPRLVHVHMSAHGSLVRKAPIVLLASAMRIPVVLHVHASDLHTFHDQVRRPVQWLIRRTLESATVVVALGRLWTERIGVIAPRARVRVVPNASVIGPPANPHEPGTPLRFLFLGRVGERKGTFDLIEAWRRCAPADRAELVIAGDGEVERARSMVAELGLGDSIDVLGWIPTEGVPDLLSSVQVMVLPSYNEGQPMAILEAMGRGICIISTEAGGIPEMLGDDGGIVLVPGDIDALSGAIRTVIDDPELREALAARGAEHALRNHSAASVASLLDEVYRSVLRGER